MIINIKSSPAKRVVNFTGLRTIIRQIAFFFAIAIIVNWVCRLLNSTIFEQYLRDKILELLIYMMAINIATISVLVTKLHEIGKEEGVSFDKTIKQVKLSMIEQITLIVIACILIILYNIPIIKADFKFHDIVFNTLFTTVFIYAIDILRDTGMAIFEVIKHKK